MTWTASSWPRPTWPTCPTRPRRVRPGRCRRAGMARLRLGVPGRRAASVRGRRGRRGRHPAGRRRLHPPLRPGQPRRRAAHRLRRQGQLEAASSRTSWSATTARRSTPSWCTCCPSSARASPRSTSSGTAPRSARRSRASPSTAPPAWSASPPSTRSRTGATSPITIRPQVFINLVPDHVILHRHVPARGGPHRRRVRLALPAQGGPRRARHRGLRGAVPPGQPAGLRGVRALPAGDELPDVRRRRRAGAQRAPHRPSSTSGSPKRRSSSPPHTPERSTDRPSTDVSDRRRRLGRLRAGRPALRRRRRRRCWCWRPGGRDYPWDLFIQMPAALTFPIGNRFYDWRYSSEPEPHLDDRRIYHARGKVLGGSSSINGMIFQRGNPLDYERWAADPGMRSWDYAHCLPYFRRMENCLAAAPDDAFRGHDGPLSWNAARRQPAVRGVLRRRAGGRLPADRRRQRLPAGRLRGLRPHHPHGRRLSAVAGIPAPGDAPAQPTVRTRALVHRILFQGNRAVGRGVLERGAPG